MESCTNNVTCYRAFDRKRERHLFVSGKHEVSAQQRSAPSHDARQVADAPHQNSLRCYETGQASVEYAVVLVGFLVLIIALGALHSFLEDGALIEHALQNSSHAIERICSGTTKDVMCV